MKVQCPRCGAVLSGLEATSQAPPTCVVCGVEVPWNLGRDEAANPVPDLTTRPGQDPAEVVREAATTLFQPGLLLDEEEGAPEASLPAPRTSDPGTEVVASPVLEVSTVELEDQPFFLILGAPPGKERLEWTSARTTFGRDRADIVLDDDAVSAPHFQVDVMGREFFVRDLASRNGTRLNGHDVRYSELLPGDEIQAGRTVLVFRTTGDGLSARGRKS